MNIKELEEEVKTKNIPSNVAIILDGNGRWAKKRGLPRIMGHAEGIKGLVKIAEASQDLGIKNLFVYAFSTENWSRPKDEVEFLMKALVNSLKKYKKSIIKRQMRVKIIGEKDHLTNDILASINDIEEASKDFNGFTLYICFNYGGKQEILHATRALCEKVKNGELDINDINIDMFESNLYSNEAGNIDLLIRTSGEERLSNFLPWQLAYAEFIFTKTYWPDFHKRELLECVHEYQMRNRRFGGLENKNE